VAPAQPAFNLAIASKSSTAFLCQAFLPFKSNCPNTDLVLELPCNSAATENAFSRKWYFKAGLS
jgi:hypothetical protein